MKTFSPENEAAYKKSNKKTTVSLNKFKTVFFDRLLTDKSRKADAQTLVTYLSDKFRIAPPAVCVMESRQPHQTGYSEWTGRSRLKNKTMGLYNRSNATIYIYNRTAIKGEEVSIKAFADTLLHEFMHHYDYYVLKLPKSLHTAGFYKRISDLKAKLSK